MKDRSEQRIRNLHRKIRDMEDQKSASNASAMTMIGSLGMRLRNLEKAFADSQERIAKLTAWVAEHEQSQADYIESVKAKARTKMLREAKGVPVDQLDL
jgi:hypothetical protein